MTPTPKPEPMSAERPRQIEKPWGIANFTWRDTNSLGDRFAREELARAETERLYALALEKERDRLSAALVAANAELVSERAAHAEIKAQLLATQKDRYRIMCERDAAERKLAAAEQQLAIAIDAMNGAIDIDEASARIDAIASNAPAKATKRCAQCKENITKDAPYDVCLMCAADGPASKPLVETPLSLGAELRSVLNRHSAENASNTPDFILADALVATLDVLTRAINDRDSWYGVRLAPGQIHKPVVIPSTKADEGKACDDYWCAARDCPTHRGDPAPPALTREEVAKMLEHLCLRIVDIDGKSYVFIKSSGAPGDSIRAADIVRAALSDGGAK